MHYGLTQLYCALLLYCSAVPAALAIDCHATGGHREGQTAWTVRHIAYLDDKMIVTGDFRERYVLTCVPLDRGVVCHGKDGKMDIIVVANAANMLESVSDSTNGREQLAHTYVCEGPVDVAVTPAGAPSSRGRPDGR